MTASAPVFAILTPSHGYTKPRHTASRDGLIIHTLSRQVRFAGREATPVLQSFIAESANLCELRRVLVERALASSADFILWLDDDQTFPPETLLRLAAHGLPMVGCNVRMRDPLRVVSSCYNMVDGERRRIEPKATGLEEVDVLGFGICLMRAEVFRALPQPWFVMGPEGEDGHLCALARAHGIRPTVDHALSSQVGHLADVELRF